MPEAAAAMAEGPHISPQSFRRFAELITQQLGIKMSEHKIPMLQSRLQRRLRLLGLPSFEAYRDLLFDEAQGAGELTHFIDAVTTNKTDFFREPRHFEFLRSTALPELDDAPSRPWHFKLWCAGCSTGEEAYTLAMVLAEHAAVRTGLEYSILATDISSRVLETARTGIFAAERLEPVDESLRRKYFLRSRSPERQLVRASGELRNRVHFHRLNFMEREYAVEDQFDAIFFRNVMIYFDKTTQEAVVSRLCRNLRAGGYLFVGHSESLIGLQVPVEMVGSAVYRKVS